MHINSKHLRAVAALAEHQNFHRAAEELCITQPALTLSIKNTEELLGLTLFDRSKNPVTLTDAGQIVTRYAKEIIGKFDSLGTDLNAFQNLGTGEIRFGVGIHLVKNVFPKVIDRFCHNYPNVRPYFEVASFDHLHEALMDDRISFYVADIAMAQEEEALNIIELKTYPIILASRPDHPLLELEHIQVKDLIQYPFIAISAKISKQLKNWFRNSLDDEKELELMERHNPYIYCDYYEATRAIIQTTDYISGGPNELLQKDISRGLIAQLPLPDLDTGVATGIVYRKDRTLSPAAMELISYFESACQDEEPSDPETE